MDVILMKLQKQKKNYKFLNQMFVISQIDDDNHVNNDPKKLQKHNKEFMSS